MIKRKIVAFVLVIVLTTLSSIVSFSADGEDFQTTGEIYFCVSNMNLRNTSWDTYHDILAHIWNAETNEELTVDGKELRGWSTFGNQNTLKFDLRSYGLALDPNIQYRIVFENKSINNSTHPLLFDVSCIGGTVYCNNSSRDYYEYYGKNSRKEYIARWGRKPDTNEDNAPEIVIREEAGYYGDTIFVYGERFSKYTNARRMVSDYIADSLDSYLVRNSRSTAQYVLDSVASQISYQEEQNYYQKSLYREDVEEAIYLTGKDVDWYADKSSLESDKYLNRFFEGAYYLRIKGSNDEDYYNSYINKFTMDSNTGYYLLSDYNISAFFDGVAKVSRYIDGIFYDVTEELRIASSAFKDETHLFYFEPKEDLSELCFNTEDELKSIYNYKQYSIERFASASPGSGWGYTAPENVPRITQLRVLKDGIKIRWRDDGSNKKYRVYTKTGNAWVPIGETNRQSFIDKNVISGHVYSYTVCGISEDSKEETTIYIEYPIWSCRFLESPYIDSIQYQEDGVLLSWNKIVGTAKYKILKGEDGHWDVVGSTGDTSYLYKGSVSEDSEFAVACASYDEYSVTSAYDRGNEIIGDTNGSGEIEIVDTTFIQRYLSYIPTPYSREELLRGDVDDSGELEIIDATAIQYFLANMKTPFSIGESL